MRGEERAVLRLPSRAYSWLRGYPAVVGFLILFGFALVGFLVSDAQDRKLERQQEKIERQQDEIIRLAKAVVVANREGCERVNVLRENQANILRNRTVDLGRALGGPLNGLERLRGHVERGLAQAKRDLRDLRVSVDDFPVRGKRYTVDCVKAYP